ncbi:MAG: hypothetical protein LBE74_08710 [Treponema sp.]|nr:hypothetical protein [Treponema sp.]
MNNSIPEHDMVLRFINSSIVLQGRKSRTCKDGKKRFAFAGPLPGSSDNSVSFGLSIRRNASCKQPGCQTAYGRSLIPSGRIRLQAYRGASSPRHRRLLSALFFH